MRSWLSVLITDAESKKVFDIPIAPSLYSLSNKMDNSLLAVRDINHKHIVVDSRREKFKIGKAYEHKIDVINVITAPEIEMLIIFAENQYKEFKKSGKKPSDFCKENLRMSDVKSYDYVFNYFSNSGILVEAIKEYHRTAKIPKGEYTLLDLLK